MTDSTYNPKMSQLVHQSSVISLNIMSQNRAEGNNKVAVALLTVFSMFLIVITMPFSLFLTIRMVQVSELLSLAIDFIATFSYFKVAKKSIHHYRVEKPKVIFYSITKLVNLYIQIFYYTKVKFAKQF